MIRALMNGTVETKDILLSLGIMLISIAGSGLLKSKAVMLQTEGAMTLVRKTGGDCGASEVSADGIL